MGAATPIKKDQPVEEMADKIFEECRDDLIDFLKNAGHAANQSTDKMSASFTMTASINKKINRGKDVSHTLTVDNRVRIPSEKASWDVEIVAGEQLRLL